MVHNLIINLINISMTKPTFKHFLRSSLLVLQCSFTVVGTVVGAGFASGKEIASFLGIYNSYFLFACIFFCLLFGCGLYLCFFTKRITLNKITQKVSFAGIFICNFISFTAMLSAIDSSIKMASTCQIWYFLCLILIYLVIVFGVNGLNKCNLVLVPALFFILLFMGYLGLKNNDILNTVSLKANSLNLVTSVPMYMGLNLYGVYPVATELSPMLSKKQQMGVSFLSSLLILLLLLCAGVTVLNASTNAICADLPLLFYAAEKHSFMFIPCVLTLTIAIITTNCANGFILVSQVKDKVKHKNLFLLVLFAVCLPLSKFGFSNIVKYIYPISGAIGINMLTLIFAEALRALFLEKKKHKQLNNSTQNKPTVNQQSN